MNHEVKNSNTIFKSDNSIVNVEKPYWKILENLIISFGERNKERKEGKTKNREKKFKKFNKNMNHKDKEY